MKASVSKKISSLVLALAVMFTTVFAAGVPVQAATVTSFTKGISKVTDVSLKGDALKGASTVAYALQIGTEGPDALLLNETESVSTGETKTYTVDIPSANTTYFMVAVAKPVAFQMTITNLSTGDALLDGSNGYVSADDSAWEYYEGLWLKVFSSTTSLTPGQYRVELTFMETIATPALNQTKATITKGFTKKLSVTDGKVKSWSSSNPKVATVDKKGKVTAKKKGNATITATLTDGNKLKCKITVKDNKYTARKITVSDVPSGKYSFEAYSASFDKKGNLVVKARYVNCTSHRVSEICDIRVTVKDVNGKTVGTFKQSKKKVSISSGSTKDFTFTLKKSSLKKKKADLRGGDVTINENSYYYSYY